MLLVIILLVCKHPDKLIPNTIIPFRNFISSRAKTSVCSKLKKPFCSTITLTLTLTIFIGHTEPTLEARAEAKLVWTMPCKEEEDDSQITETTECFFTKTLKTLFMR